MSREEAEQVLREFLDDGDKNIDIVIAHASSEGVNCNYTIASLSAFLRWAFSEMRALPRQPDPEVPEWIRSTAAYQSGLFDFDERSKNLICFAAFYLGQCFVREYPSLKWSTGNPDLHQANMPVVTGFANGKELPPSLVIENLFRRITRMPNRIDDIDKATDTWEKNVA